MKQFIPTYTKWSYLVWLVLLLNGLLPTVSGWLGHADAQLQAQCNTAAPGVLVKWDFNSRTVVCNGAVPKGDGDLTAPFLLKGQNNYCPNINNGCGAALLGTKGFGNTYDFKNAICLAGFWRNDGGFYAAAPGWSLTDPVFHPEIAANLNISYSLPAGKVGTLSSFSLKIVQKQFDGINPAFAKQGVGVYRNGVLIHTETKTITAADVNSGTMTFTFPNTPEFTSDGSAKVDFEVVFGLVNRLIKISTGYDDICLIGTCGGSGSPAPTAAIMPTTCGAGSANGDGRITLTNFGATDKYDISMAGSYTGTQTYATATTIPGGGIITSTLPNPATPQVYTVRVFTAAGCTTDLRVTLNPTRCSDNCTPPTATLVATGVTCAGTSPNNNASIAITGVTGGNRVGISPGTFYAGTLYAQAQPLVGGAYTFTALPNPNGSQVYTVRVFNADDDCFKDFPVTLNETSCGCKKIAVQVKKSDQGDPDSNPNNNATSEDDLATYEVCKGTQFIDLKLTKTANPTIGSTCPTNTNFVWTIVLTNAGTMAATNIQITDDMPADLLLTTASVTSGTYTISGGWLIPSLSAGASTTLSLTVKATKPGTYQNCAWVSGAFPLNDPNSSPLNDNTANEDDDACATITVTGARTPTISKEFSPNTARTNTPFRLTIKLTNNETTPITLTAPLVDNLPASPAQMTVAPTPNLTSSLPGVLATAGGSNITIPTGTVLAPGLNLVEVDVIAPADGEYCNKLLAGALKTTSCDNVAEAEACVIVKSTFVMGPLIKKTFEPAVVAAGQSTTLTITIENRNATGITVLQNFIDELPAGLVVAGPVTGTCPGLSVFSTTNQVGITAGSVISPGSCTIRVPVRGSTAGNYCNTIIENALIGNVSNGTIQVMTGNDGIATACLTVSPNPCTALDITSVTPTPLTVAPGGTVNLTLNGTGFGASTLYAWTGPGAFNPQSFTTTYTAPATTGTYTLTVSADNRLTGYGACADVLTVPVVVQNQPTVCSIGLSPAPVQSACNDNGTPAVATDDYFTVTISATAVNGGASGRYEVVIGANADGTGGTVLNAGGTAYGTAANVGTATTFKADGTTTYVVTVRDLNSPTCKATFTTTVVQSCSGCPPQLCIPMAGLKQ